jgi:hypothetical protein
METNFCKTPCGECPFKKVSTKGWLGEFTVEETLKASMADQDFLCHVSGRGSVKRQCAGRMLFASKTAKMFRSPIIENIRKEVRDANPNFREDILGFEFRSHHSL